MNIIFILSVFFALIITSCGNKKVNITDDRLPKDTSKRFVLFQDTDTFLNSWSKENDVIVHWTGDPLTLHPTNENNANRHFIAQFTHATLMSLNMETLSLEPDLAKDFPKISSDGLVYEYEIKQEAKWDDGSDVTAEDIIFTFKVNKCQLVKNPFAKSYLEPLKEVNGKDKTVQFYWEYKYILNDYLTTDFAILQQRFYDPEGVFNNYTFQQLSDSLFNSNPPEELVNWANTYNSEKYGTEIQNLKGLGPYQVESWDRGQTLVLKKKQNHWYNQIQNPTRKQVAYPDKMYFKTILDDNALQIELLKQGVDVTAFLSTKGLMDLQENSDFVTNYHSEFVPFFNIAVINMNNRADGIKRKKLFTDKNVRRAMAHLTPMDDIIEILYFGKAARLTGPVSPLKKEFNKNLKPIPYDIEKAKSLLKQAGWVDSDNDNVLDKNIDGKKVPFEFELIYMTNSPVTKDISEMIAESMIKVGIKANPVGLDIGAVITKAQSHDFDMLFTSFGGSGAPDDFKQLWHTSSWTNNGSNFSGFGNSQSDALIDSIRVELDEEKRLKMVMRFQEMVYNEQPVIFLMNSSRKIAIHKRFGNAAGFYEKPGVSVNSLKLLYGGIIQQNSTMN